MASSSMKALKSSSLFLIIIIFLSLQSFQAKGHGGHDEDSTADGEDPVDLHSKGLVLVKIWCLIILLVSTFAGGVSPYFYRWNETFLLLGTQFSGGIFLGTSLMHFLSDSTETFRDLTSKEYPFSFMLASAGYVLTMLGDCLVMLVAKGSDGEAKVEVEDGRRAAAADGKEMSMELHPAFLKTANLGDTVLLILALCFHSVFEGIAIGVAGESFFSPPLNSNVICLM